MGEVLANELRFHVQRLRPNKPGDHPTVVFIHGLVIDNLSSFYYTLANPVAQQGCDVILYDLRGHGRSERPADGYALDDAVADLVAILDRLDVVGPVYLVGNSFGGIVAANTALAHPERVAGLVLIESPCAGEIARTWLEDITNTLSVSALGLEHNQAADEFGGLGSRRNARQAHVASALLNDTTMIDDLAAVEPVEPALLLDLACPALAVYGERSELAGAAAELLDRAGWTVAILPGDIGHSVLRDASSGLRELLLRWLLVHSRPARPAGALAPARRTGG